MKEILLIHGFASNTNDCWFPWLRENLNGYKIINSNWPDSAFPNYKEVIKYHKQFKQEFLSGKLICVSHSLGGFIALKLAEKYKISKLILVAPPGYPENPTKILEKYKESRMEKYAPTLLEFFKDAGPFNLTRIKQNVKDLTVLFSTDDPIIDLERQEEFIKQIPFANYVILEGYGHFGSANKIFKLPEILELL